MRTLFLTIFLLCSICSLGYCQDVEFITHANAYGFSVSIPDGWDVRVLGSGCIVIGEDLENFIGPQVFIWPISLSKQISNRSILEDVINTLRQFYPDIKMTSIRDIGAGGSLCILKAHFSDRGILNTLVLSCSIDNGKAFVSGFSTPAIDYSKNRKILVKILSSFKIDPGLRDISKIAPSFDKFFTYTDPNERAFTILVPNGWQAQGGLIRPYIDAAISLNIIKDPAGLSAIYIALPSIPIFTEPNQLLSMAGFPEGSRYNPSGGLSQDMIVWRYLPGSTYIREYFLRNTKKTYPDLKILSTKDRPDLIRALPQMPWLATQTDAGEVIIEFTMNNVKEYAKIIAVTQRTTVPSGPSIWTANVVTFNSPIKDFAQVEDITHKVTDSLHIDPNWKIRESQEVIKRSNIISRSADEVSDIIRSTYEKRSAVLDEVSRKWSNAIRGTVDLVDPNTGKLISGVPNTSNYYWKQADTIIGTEIHERPGINFNELGNYDEIIKD